VLVILPPSESKRPPPATGPCLELERLSFPELTATRIRVMDALIATSQRPDALRRLQVRPSLRGEVALNVSLHELPTRPVVETYAGPLYQGLGAASWSQAESNRASTRFVTVSALWGALRPYDWIPPYRLYVCARLIGMDRLEPMWRTVLPAVLDDAAGSRGPILDLRSRAYQSVGRPPGMDDQTVTLRVRPAPGGKPHIGDVIAKRVRGEAARLLLSIEHEAEHPLDIADALAERWPIVIEPPRQLTRSWTITLQAPIA
jgi:uncharacterized protein